MYRRCDPDELGVEKKKFQAVDPNLLCRRVWDHRPQVLIETRQPGSRNLTALNRFTLLLSSREDGPNRRLRVGHHRPPHLRW